MYNEDYILMANDDIDEQQLFLFILANTELDKKIVFVNDGWELMNFLADKAIAKEKLPKWVILDVDMPKLNGTQTLKLIREIVIYKPIRIFMYGDDDSEATQYSYRMSGCNGFIDSQALRFKGKQMALTLKQFWENELQCLINLQDYRSSLARQRNNDEKQNWGENYI